MKRTVSWFTALLFLGVGTQAAAAAMVWRVTAAHNAVYFAASMHVLPERAYPLPRAFQRAYADSRLLVVEADEQALQNPMIGRRFNEAARYTAGDLQSHIGGRLYARTRRVLRDDGLSVERLDGYRPWFVSMMIEQRSYARQGFRPELGLESYFFAKARADARPILPLQTIAAHLAVLTAMPPALSRDLLAITVDSSEALSQSPDALYDDWRRGDAAAFDQALEAQVAACPALYDRLIYDRNRAWQGSIDALLHSPANAMVLVGAAHLVGAHGLLAGLRARGYRVEQLP